MKKLDKGQKGKILKVSLTLLGLVLFSGLVIIILYFGFNINLFSKTGALVLRDKMNRSWWGVPLYLLLYMVIATTTSFIPFTSMAMILLGVELFKDLGGGGITGIFIAFGIALVGVFLTSMLLYLLGRFGGRKLGSFILGDEDIEKATKLLETKGQVYLPLMLMFPMFPDDALCFASGVLKMKWWYFMIIVIVFRGIGVFTLSFIGDLWGNYIEPNLTTPFMWAMFIIAVIFCVVSILFLANKLDKHLEKKRNNKSIK